MTEKLGIANGELVVERPVKGDLNVDLSNVERVHYERGANGPGALVLTEKDGTVSVVRVDEEDAPEVMEALYANLRQDAQPEAAQEKAEETQPAPVAPASNGQRKQNRR